MTALASIIIMFLISKLLGNKQISELNMFDYINGITIGSIASEMAVADSWEKCLGSRNCNDHLRTYRFPAFYFHNKINKSKTFFLPVFLCF